MATARPAEYYMSAPTHIAPVSFDAGVPSLNDHGSTPRASTKNVIEGAIALLSSSPSTMSPPTPANNDPWSPQLNKSIKVESPSLPATKSLQPKKRSSRYAVPAPSTGAARFVSKPFPEFDAANSNAAAGNADPNNVSKIATNTSSSTGNAKDYPDRPLKSRTNSRDGDRPPIAASVSEQMQQPSDTPASPPIQKKTSLISRFTRRSSSRKDKNESPAPPTPVAAPLAPPNAFSPMHRAASTGNLLSSPASNRPSSVYTINPEPPRRSFAIPQTLAEWEEFNREMMERAQRPRPPPPTTPGTTRYGLRPPSTIGSGTPGSRTPRSGSGSPAGGSTPRKTPAILPVEMPPPITLGDWEKALMTPARDANKEVSPVARSPRASISKGRRASYVGEPLPRPAFPRRQSSSGTTTPPSPSETRTPGAASTVMSPSEDTPSRNRTASLPVTPTASRPSLDPIITTIGSPSLLWKRPTQNSKPGRRASASESADPAPASTPTKLVKPNKKASKESLMGKNVLVKKSRPSLDVTTTATTPAADAAAHTNLNDSQVDLPGANANDPHTATAPRKKRNSFSDIFKRRPSMDKMVAQVKKEAETKLRAPMGPPPGAAPAAIPAQFTAGHTYEVQAPLPEVVALNSLTGHLSTTSLVVVEKPGTPEVGVKAVKKKSSFNFGFGKMKKTPLTVDLGISSSDQLQLPHEVIPHGQQVESPIQEPVPKLETSEPSSRRSSKRFSFGMKRKEGSESTVDLSRPSLTQTPAVTPPAAEPTPVIQPEEEAHRPDATPSKRRSLIYGFGTPKRNNNGSDSTPNLLSRAGSTQDLVVESTPAIAPGEEPQRPDVINAKRRSFISSFSSLKKKEGVQSMTDLVGDDDRRPATATSTHDSSVYHSAQTHLEEHSLTPMDKASKRRSINFGFQGLKRKEGVQSSIDLVGDVDRQLPLTAAVQDITPSTSTPVVDTTIQPEVSAIAPSDKTSKRRSINFGFPSLRKKEGVQSTTDLVGDAVTLAAAAQDIAPSSTNTSSSAGDTTSQPEASTVAPSDKGSKRRSINFGFQRKKLEASESTIDVSSISNPQPLQSAAVHNDAPLEAPAAPFVEERKRRFSFGVKRKDVPGSTVDLALPTDQPQQPLPDVVSPPELEDAPPKAEEGFSTKRSRAFSFLKKRDEGSDASKAEDTTVPDLSADKPPASEFAAPEAGSGLTPPGTVDHAAEGSSAPAESSSKGNRRLSLVFSLRNSKKIESSTDDAVARPPSPVQTEEWVELPPSTPLEVIPSLGMPGSPPLRPLDLKGPTPPSSSGSDSPKRPTIRQRVSSLLKSTSPSVEDLTKLEGPGASFMGNAWGRSPQPSPSPRPYTPLPPPPEMPSPHSTIDRSLPVGQFRTLTGKMSLAEAAANRSPRTPTPPEIPHVSRFFVGENETPTNAATADSTSEQWSEDLQKDMDGITPVTPGEPLKALSNPPNGENAAPTAGTPSSGSGTTYEY
ncbi:hypothetical protein FRB94_012573 [Tulasnella sp. JGI-2019a]|nr:hypothetical protein FRB93_001464 [Tulasnella sp. JGI-2019a]KAG9009049.1 hypothetical protein FRB94_012573 [Tulasnella sp. JGI-2019a]